MELDSKIKKIIRESLLKEGYIEDLFQDETMWGKFSNILGDRMLSYLFDYFKEYEMTYEIFSYLGSRCEELGLENPMSPEEDEEYYEDEEDDSF